MKKQTVCLFCLLVFAFGAAAAPAFAETPDIDDDASAYGYLYDSSQGLLVMESNPEVVGDLYRYSMTVFKPNQFITYKFEGKTHAVVTVYYDILFEDGATYEDVIFWVSSDNASWQEAVINTKSEEIPEKMWAKVVYDISFDASTNYLKIEFIQPNATYMHGGEALPVVWSPQIGHVLIDNQPGAEPDGSAPVREPRVVEPPAAKPVEAETVIHVPEGATIITEAVQEPEKDSDTNWFVMIAAVVLLFIASVFIALMYKKKSARG